MGNSGAVNMRVVLWVVGILLLVAMVIGGQFIFAGVILVFLLILAVGALMYRKMGPPPTS